MVFSTHLARDPPPHPHRSQDDCITSRRLGTKMHNPQQCASPAVKEGEDTRTHDHERLCPPHINIQPSTRQQPAEQDIKSRQADELPPSSSGLPQKTGRPVGPSRVVLALQTAYVAGHKLRGSGEAIPPMRSAYACNTLRESCPRGACSRHLPGTQRHRSLPSAQPRLARLGGTVRRDRGPARKASWWEMQRTGTGAASFCKLPAAYGFCSQTNPGSEKFPQSSVHLAKPSYKIHLSTITDSWQLKRTLGCSHFIKLLLFKKTTGLKEHTFSLQ